MREVQLTFDLFVTLRKSQKKSDATGQDTFSERHFLTELFRTCDFYQTTDDFKCQRKKSTRFWIPFEFLVVDRVQEMSRYLSSAGF